VDKSIYSKNYQLLISLLKKARVEAGVTQAELASRLKETQTFISKCERGERRLDIIEVREFCFAIGIKFTDFVNQLESKLPKRKNNSNK